jgi:hypothetical protein
MDPNKIQPAVVEVLQKADRECMLRKLNLETNRDRKIQLKRGILLIISTTLLCVENTDEGFADFIESLSGFVSEDGKIVECMMEVLHRSEPNSPLLKNFDINRMRQTVAQCKEETGEKSMDEILRIYEVEKNTCGVYNVESSKQHFSRIYHSFAGGN